MNVAANCWDICGHRAGLCPQYCGTLGACCQAGKPGAGCPLTGGDPFWHSCRAADLSTLILIAEKAAAFAPLPQAVGVTTGGGVAAVGAAAVLTLAVAAAMVKKRIGARAVVAPRSTSTATML
jgi:hypothetical protein